MAVVWHLSISRAGVTDGDSDTTKQIQDSCRLCRLRLEGEMNDSDDSLSPQLYGIGLEDS